MPADLLQGKVLVNSVAARSNVLSLDVDDPDTGYVNAAAQPPLGSAWVRFRRRRSLTGEKDAPRICGDRLGVWKAGAETNKEPFSLVRRLVLAKV